MDIKVIEEAKMFGVGCNDLIRKSRGSQNSKRNANFTP